MRKVKLVTLSKKFGYGYDNNNSIRNLIKRYNRRHKRQIRTFVEIELVKEPPNKPRHTPYAFVSLGDAVILTKFRKETKGWYQ